MNLIAGNLAAAGQGRAFAKRVIPVECAKHGLDCIAGGDATKASCPPLRRGHDLISSDELRLKCLSYTESVLHVYLIQHLAGPCAAACVCKPARESLGQGPESRRRRLGLSTKKPRAFVLHVASAYKLPCEGGFNPIFQRPYGVDFVIFCHGVWVFRIWCFMPRPAEPPSETTWDFSLSNGSVQWARFVGEPKSSALSKLDGPPSPRGGLTAAAAAVTSGYGLGSTSYRQPGPLLCRPTVLYGIIVDSHRCPRWVSLEGSYCT